MPSGTHDGADGEALLIDSGANFIVDGVLAGQTVNNDTDGSSGTIDGVTPTTIIATLTGGTDNDWDDGDSYSTTP